MTVLPRASVLNAGLYAAVNLAGCLTLPCIGRWATDTNDNSLRRFTKGLVLPMIGQAVLSFLTIVYIDYCNERQISISSLEAKETAVFCFYTGVVAIVIEIVREKGLGFDPAH